MKDDYPKIKKKWTMQLKHKQDVWTNASSERIYSFQVKIYSPPYIISEVEISTSVYLLEWPISKALLMTTAGGEVENRKLPFISHWDLKPHTDKPGKDMQNTSGKFQEQILLCTAYSEKAELWSIQWAFRLQEESMWRARDKKTVLHGIAVM